MTSFGAYDEGLPCKNPDCNSYGSPHPNCKCYGGMSKGGEAQRFCDQARKHNKECKFFAQGGDTSSNFDPDAYINAQPAQTTAGQPTAPSDSSFDPDAYLGTSPASSFDPNAYLGAASTPPTPIQTNDYGSTSQQILTGIEGLGKGIAGPTEAALSYAGSQLPESTGVPGVLKQLTLTPEDIAGRETENPSISEASELAGQAGSLATGVGELPLVGAGLKSLIGTGVGPLTKIGSTALRTALTGMSMQGSDEITKSLLGKGDATNAVGSALANVGAAGLFSLGLGTLGGIANSALSSVAESKLGSTLSDFAQGAGLGASGLPLPNDASAAVKAGNQVYNRITGIANVVGPAYGGVKGYQEGGFWGSVAGIAAGRTLSKYEIPAMVKMISNGDTNNVGDVLDYVKNIESGLQKTTNAVTSLFGGASQQFVNDTNAGEKLKEYIQNGGMNQNVTESIYQFSNPTIVPQMAEGGEVNALPLPSDEDVSPAVRDHPVLATHFPEHSLAINAAKGRISNYLKSIEPTDLGPKLAFDDPADNSEQKRSYEKAIRIANQPLSIVNEIKDGTIEPEHVKHLNAMHPEVSSLLNQKITEGITQAQLDGKKPSYQVRQGLSLFMGTPMSGELTPQNIQAAQSVFAPPAPPANAPVTKNKKNTSSLKNVSNAYLTDNQSRIEDQQRAN